MELTAMGPDSIPAAGGGCVNALQVDGAERFLFISGQIPQTRGGHVPTDVQEQCRLVWANVLAVLDAAGMSVGNLVEVTTFLSPDALR